MKKLIIFLVVILATTFNAVNARETETISSEVCTKAQQKIVQKKVKSFILKQFPT